MEIRTSKEVLVCGHPALCRIEGSVLPAFGSELAIRGAHTRDELLAAISEGKHPVCIIDFLIPDVDAMKTHVRLGNEWGISMMRKYTPLYGEPAHMFLPALISRSPATKFVITLHVRAGIERDELEPYKAFPAVAKVMGFVNSKSNATYLKRLLSRIYFDMAWKPEP
jgi:hypothetical protein